MSMFCILEHIDIGMDDNCHTPSYVVMKSLASQYFIIYLLYSKSQSLAAEDLIQTFICNYKTC